MLNLLCQKELRRNDISNQLTFPTHALAAFGFAPGVHGTDFHAFDTKDEPWEFRLSVRSGRHPNPVILRSSWHRLVEAKKLREGDRVTFFTEQTVDGLRFHVRAHRKCINILGARDDDEEVYVDVERFLNNHPFFRVI